MGLTHTKQRRACFFSPTPSIEGIAGKNGQHFITGELNEMGSHIVSLMRNPERAQHIAKEARELAFKIYDNRRFIENTGHLLKDFICKN